MCPRQMKQRINVDPDKLLPKLPKPRDLKVNGTCRFQQAR
jgi:ribosome biogenesis protein ERB1